MGTATRKYVGEDVGVLFGFLKLSQAIVSTEDHGENV